MTWYTRIVRTNDGLYVLGITREYRSYTIRIVSLNPETGETIATAIVPSATVGYDEFQVLVGPNKIDASVLWLERESLKAVKLTPDLTLLRKTVSTTYGPYQKLLEVGTELAGYAVLQATDGEAHVFKVGRDALELERVVQFESSVSFSTFFNWSAELMQLAGRITHVRSIRGRIR